MQQELLWRNFQPLGCLTDNESNSFLVDRVTFSVQHFSYIKYYQRICKLQFLFFLLAICMIRVKKLHTTSKQIQEKNTNALFCVSSIRLISLLDKKRI